MAGNQSNLFRKETLAHISSPEHLTEYIRVTNPGIWILLTAVILLLAGLFIWGSIGTLETTEDVTIIVEDHTAHAAAQGSEELAQGMPLRFAGQQFAIASVETDAYGRSIGIAEADVPDGTYSGTVVLTQTKPIEFLLNSR